MGILANCFLAIGLIITALAARVYLVLNTARTLSPEPQRQISENCSLAVFLGSGGHTSEALSLLSALDFARYSPRTYFIGEGDALSMRKALELESLKAADTHKGTQTNRNTETPYSFVVIPRARHVHQPLLTTPVTVVLSLAASIWRITVAPLLFGPPVAEILLLNGPGTCLVLCIAAHLNRILGLRSPRLIYIESFARVRHLSLSGKLLRPLVDRFVVQWPELAKKDGKRVYRGWLV
ncbi:oligosaccharide biosynthesis protein Alg14 like-domain-containing protein [Trametes meyenii]|nr:oligosaccharide biosynthesis protein Alg14 like-domain-containing protein [Trametes meyenii]